MSKSPQKTDDDRYTAMLLFQFRVVADGVSNRRRLCEKRLIVFHAQSGHEALKEAKKRGRRAQHHYANAQGGQVYFEFVGILDLLHIGVECEDDEVWYQLCKLMEPRERRGRLIPAEQSLQAIREDCRRKKV